MIEDLLKESSRTFITQTLQQDSTGKWSFYGLSHKIVNHSNTRIGIGKTPEEAIQNALINEYSIPFLSAL